MGPWWPMNTCSVSAWHALRRALHGKDLAPRGRGEQMARAGSADNVVLGERRRLRLEAMVARPTSAQRVVLRAKIVLAAWRGRSNAAIARELGIGVDTVRKWRHRFVRHGMAGLHDRPRSGRPALYDLDAHLLIVATVTQEAPQVDSHWTHRLLAHHLAQPLGISASQIGRILASLDLKPHRVRGWLNRPEDPAFVTKAQAVCALYLNPPGDAVLFSIDEKTAMQARSRKRATAALRRGRPELREFEYVRHGTVSLMAAMNVTDGTVHPKIIVANNSATFIEFLTELGATVDPARLNIVEIFFSILARRMLRRGDFASRQDLIDKILAFIATYNQTAKPFRWSYDAKLLRAA